MADGSARSLYGRAQECALLDDLLDKVREAEGSVLVMQGEAGVGKTALVDYCAQQASGFQVARIAGVESELEMPFAGSHQLCEGLLEHLDRLPEPQVRAVQVAFGLTAGDPPDRFVVGLAVLGLLAEAGTKRPLLCLVDDAQWLDEPSRQVLGFVGRRLQAEAVLLVLAVRESGDEQLFASLPSLTVEGLAEQDARALLEATVASPLDEQVRDRIVAETRGNPLRLLELPRRMSPGELAGGYDVPQLDIGGEPMHEYYTQRVGTLPEPTQWLMLLASADPTGDATLLWRAAAQLGLPRDAAAPAESEQLLEIGSDVRFRHPLVRSAAYATASAADRRQAHAALADATDAAVSPERRVWHLAAASTHANEDVAAQLEAAAAAAQARGGAAAAATFLQRSVELTADPQRLAGRALAAAQAHLQSGAFEAALALVAEARAAAVDDVQRALAERLRGQAQYLADPGAQAPLVLLKAANALESLDAALARETYLDAWMASLAAGARARPGGLLPEVSRAARSAPPARDAPAPPDLLLEALSSAVTDGRGAAASGLRRAVDVVLSDEVSVAQRMQWGHFATSAAVLRWDWRSWDTLSTKLMEHGREAGALALLSMAVHSRCAFAGLCGDTESATALVAESEAIIDVTGIGWFCLGRLIQAAYGGQPEALALIEASAAESSQNGVGQSVQYAHWTAAVLFNGLGRHEDALTSAELAAYEMDLPDISAWALPELIEAAVRSDRMPVAREAMHKLCDYTVGDADWATGVEARARALVTEGACAEAFYAEALRRLDRTPFRPEIARTHLLYGEWLRRQNRPDDARQQLAPAYDMFVAMGAEAFAQRTRAELGASGGEVRTRHSSAAAGVGLTPQEADIAQRARDGRTNAQIGAELFLSVRTIEWHLTKVFTKLGVSSRRELENALPARGRP